LHVVFASSGGAVYAPSTARRPVGEDAPLSPSTSYGIQKLAAESYLRAAAEHGWLTATVLRIGNPYGAVLPPERLQGFLGVSVGRLARAQAVRVFGDTRNVRDYVHLDDVAAIFGRVLKPSAHFAIYNVGSGEGHSVDDIVVLFERILGRSIDIERVAVKGEPGDLPRWAVLDIAKARRELGWSPTVSLDAGVERLLRDAGLST
jgi:UDP-glucose 4-epimerase